MRASTKYRRSLHDIRNVKLMDRRGGEITCSVIPVRTTRSLTSTLTAEERLEELPREDMKGDKQCGIQRRVLLLIYKKPIEKALARHLPYLVRFTILRVTDEQAFLICSVSPPSLSGVETVSHSAIPSGFIPPDRREQVCFDKSLSPASSEGIQGSGVRGRVQPSTTWAMFHSTCRLRLLERCAAGRAIASPTTGLVVGRRRRLWRSDETSPYQDASSARLLTPIAPEMKMKREFAEIKRGIQTRYVRKDAEVVGNSTFLDWPIALSASVGFHRMNASGCMPQLGPPPARHPKQELWGLHQGPKVECGVRNAERVGRWVESGIPSAPGMDEISGGFQFP
ncbi:hypothetical protein BKA70DRAFT_1397410 [Coprinopsis sp. MPI-PUGE-AT-0042]|nr:hypothetical protein BKA70DRAFT_1397410 [Coprinopsis sp. MPI-PUGE-AT-0042]